MATRRGAVRETNACENTPADDDDNDDETRKRRCQRAAAANPEHRTAPAVLVKRRNPNVKVDRNPSILLALDAVHRSLLYKNLQFDEGNADTVSSGLSGGTITHGKNPLEAHGLRKQAKLAPEDDGTHPQLRKVHPNDEAEQCVRYRDSGIVEVLDHEEEEEAIDTDEEDENEEDEELEEEEEGSEFVRDRNNNNSGRRVKMMVAKYEAKQTQTTIVDVETSDFESASVTSCSSVAASVRSSSAFSEGSRDVASVEGLHVAQQLGEASTLPVGSHMTITINIKAEAHRSRVPDSGSDTQRRVRTSPRRSPVVACGKPEIVSSAQTQSLSDAEEEAAEDVPVRGEVKTTREDIEVDSSVGSRSCTSPEVDVYHDCDELNNSTNSFYESVAAESRAHSPKRAQGELVKHEQESMVNIVQELTRDMQVLSTVTVNKLKVEEYRKSQKQSMKEKKDKRKEKKSHKLNNSHLSRQKIIDDNFCNEILDSTIHFDRLYGLKSAPIKHTEEVLSDSLCDVKSAGDESFDSAMSVGKLEGKARFSGRTIGHLMARRMKKLEKQRLSVEQQHLAILSDSASSNQTNGPKKPPRTFAMPQDSDRGASPKATIRPSCPRLEDMDSTNDTLGWRRGLKEKSHPLGWVESKERRNDSIPPQIYSMLNYSEDESRRRLIKTSYSKPAPQSKAKLYRRQTDPLGPKLDIDTVDSFLPRTPQRRPSSTDFEHFVANSRVKSTPYKTSAQESIQQTELFLEAERNPRRRPLPAAARARRRTTGGIFERKRQQQDNFLDDARRTNHEPQRKGPICRNCSNGRLEKKSFRKAAVKRTKSFFLASKRKIQAMKNFETPKKFEHEANMNRNSLAKQTLHHKHLGYTPDHLRSCRSCPSERPIMKNSFVQTFSEPPRVAPRGGGLPANTRPPVRSLNFSTNGEDGDEDENTNEDSKENQCDRKRKQPHEMKFLKTLRNIKISPKKLFRFPSLSGSNDRCPMATKAPHQLGEFQSYDDLNLDNVARMGDYLSNIRCAIEDNEHGNRTEERFDTAERHVSIDLPDEPLYHEISPKNNKTILNEFISNENNRRYVMVNNDPNLVYATVSKASKTNLIKARSLNNVQLSSSEVVPVAGTTSTPISKKQNNTSKSDTKPKLVNGSVSSPDKLPTSPKYHTPGTEPHSSTRHSGRNNSSGRPGSSTRRSLFSQESSYRSALDDLDVSVLPEEANIVQEALIVPERAENNMAGIVARRKVDEQMQRNSLDRVGELEYRAFQDRISERTSEIPSERALEELDGRRKGETGKKISIGTQSMMAPLGCFDTDSEIESMHRYQEPNMDDLVTSLRENITISEIGTIDTENSPTDVELGYDTVDFIPITPSRANNLGAGRTKSSGQRSSSTIDTDNISELMSSNQYSSSNVSPVQGSPTSGKSRSTTASDLVRGWKNKLRSSFNKSKTFLKVEQRRIVNYFDDRLQNKSPSDGPGSSRTARASNFDAEAYRRKYERDDICRSLVNCPSMVELSNQYLTELISQIKSQNDIRKQLKQALAICRSTAEFECSSELIEAERLLLLTTLKENAARNELSKIDYNGNGMMLNDGKKVGLVALNHFEFPLNETAIADAMFNYFYVVVCSYKNQVQASVTKERQDRRVSFRDCEIKFHNLDANYEIRVEVFVLRLRKITRDLNSFDSKNRSHKEQKGILHCPSPSKMRGAGKVLSFRSSSPKSFDFDNEFSRFKSQGFITLTSFSLLEGNHPEAVELGCNDSSRNPYYSASSNFQQLIRQCDGHNVFLIEDFKYLTLDSMAYSSNLAGTIGMSVKSEIRFENAQVSGFLTVGEKLDDAINWSRRWCKINGFTLEFWNYPQECQERRPEQQIDLAKCVNEEIAIADRIICSRPRTFKIDLFATQSATSCSSSGIGSYKSSGATGLNQAANVRSCDNIKVYLLAVDTPNELKMWLNELNRIVKFLKEWKI